MPAPGTRTVIDRRPPREVSRAALAVNATLWRATGAMYAPFAAAVLVLFALGPPEHGAGRRLVAAWLLVAADATALAAGLVAIATPVQVISCTAVLRAAEDQARELEGAIRTDPLTGVGNRRAFDEGLAAAFGHARPEGLPLSVLVVDIDDFSPIQRADPVVARTILRQIAGVIAAAIPPGSSVCRLDGDEFAAILPAVTVRGARLIALGIERTARALTRPDLQGLRVGAAAATAPVDAGGPDALVGVADGRLRDRKRERPEGASSSPPDSSAPPARGQRPS